MTNSPFYLLHVAPFLGIAAGVVTYLATLAVLFFGAAYAAGLIG